MKNHYKVIQKMISLMREYHKTFAVHHEGEITNTYLIMFRILKAHFKHGITPLLYSFFQLDNVPESEWGEYIADQKKFNLLLVGNSTVENRRIAGNKLQFYQHCTKNHLPIIPLLCVVSNDLDLRINNVEIINNKKKWCETMSTLPNELFIKPILGASGIGSFVAHKENDVFNFAGFKGSVEDLFDYIMMRVKRGRGFMVQPRVKTHSSLNTIVSTYGLSTVRVTTLRRNGKSEIIMACLKIIRGKNEHDNFSKGMSNNLIASINIETGKLSYAWGSSMSDWPKMVQYPFHPETGVKIEGFSLPSWHEIVELSLRAQDSLPFLPTIGWDIALTNEGVLIVEANTAYDASLFQLFQQRGMKSEFQKLFNSQ